MLQPVSDEMAMLIDIPFEEGLSQKPRSLSSLQGPRAASSQAFARGKGVISKALECPTRKSYISCAWQERSVISAAMIGSCCKDLDTRQKAQSVKQDSMCQPISDEMATHFDVPFDEELTQKPRSLSGLQGPRAASSQASARGTGVIAKVPECTPQVQLSHIVGDESFVPPIPAGTSCLHATSELAKGLRPTIERSSAHLQTSLASHVVVPEYEMYVMTVKKFAELPILEAHETMLKRGFVAPVLHDAVVHFISHQWLCISHPDPNAVQVSRLRKILQQISDGSNSDLFSTEDWTSFSSHVRSLVGLPHEETIPAARMDGYIWNTFQMHVYDGYIWIDYACIPQNREAGGQEKHVAAIRSLPVYLERCNYFWILTPSAEHVDTKEVCNFSTWRRRGWCRLEEWGNFLSVNACTPLVVSDSGTLGITRLREFELAAQGKPHMAPCAGEFSCCRLDHEIILTSGKTSVIPCDKKIILPVLEQLFEQKRVHLRRLPNSLAHRFLLGLVEPMIFGGADVDWQSPFHIKNMTVDKTLEHFVEHFGLASIIDVGSPPISVWNLAACIGHTEIIKKLQFSPEAMQQVQDPELNLSVIHWAAMQGQVDVLRILVESSIAPVEALTWCGGVQKLTALHQAAQHGFPDAVEFLLQKKADANLCRADGYSPLHGAAESGHLACCKALLLARANIDVQTAKGCTPLHLASELLTFYGSADGKPDVTRYLIQSEACVSLLDRSGRTARDVAEDSHFFAVLRTLDAEEAMEETQAVNSLREDILRSERLALGMILTQGTSDDDFDLIHTARM